MKKSILGILFRHKTYTLLKNNQVAKNGIPLLRTGKHLCGTPYSNPVTSTKKKVKLANSLVDKEFPFEVESFTYDGFGVEHLNKLAPYRAIFKEWTRDPGIFIAKCSDNIERKIPSCQLYGLDFMLPEQVTKDVLFGISSAG